LNPDMSTTRLASRPLPTKGPSASGDELDDLFNYEVGGEDDPYGDNYKVPTTKDVTKDAGSKDKSGSGLGIDEEVEVTRKPRVPRVKLDEHRYNLQFSISNFC
jgi:replication fork protection complex subunit Csm3/Swi3